MWFSWASSRNWQNNGSRTGQREVKTARFSGHWRQLTLVFGDGFADAGPTRRDGGPDRRLRRGNLRIVEGAGAHEDQMRARFGLTEERRSARRAETPVHPVAAVGDTLVVA